MPEESEEIQNQDIDIDDLLSDIFRSESSDRKNDLKMNRIMILESKMKVQKILQTK